MTTTTVPMTPSAAAPITKRPAAVQALVWHELRENGWLLVGVYAIAAAMVAIAWSPARFRFILPPAEAAPFASLAATPHLVWQALQLLVTTAVVAAPALAFSRPRQRGTMGRLLTLPLSRGQLFLGKLLGAGAVSLIAASAGLAVATAAAPTEGASVGFVGVPLALVAFSLARLAFWIGSAIAIGLCAGLLIGNMLGAALVGTALVWGLDSGLHALYTSIVTAYWPVHQNVTPIAPLAVLAGHAVVTAAALALAVRLTRRLEPRPAPIDGKKLLRVAAVGVLLAAVAGGAWVWQHQATPPPSERATLVYELVGDKAGSPSVLERTAAVLSARLRALDAFAGVRVDKETTRVTADVAYRTPEDLTAIQKALALPGHVSFHAVAGRYGRTSRQRGDETIQSRIREIQAAKAAGTYRSEDEAYDVAIYRDTSKGAKAEELPVLLRNDGAVDGQEMPQAGVRQEPGGQWRIDFVLTPLGRSQFALLTREHVQEDLAIVLDGRILTAPRIKSMITGGRGLIEGDFTEAEAKRIAALLSSGPLPAPIRLIPATAQDR